MILVVAPVLHNKLPTQPVAVRVEPSPVQHKYLFVLITGGFGGVPMVIITLFDTLLAPQLFTHVAV